MTGEIQCNSGRFPCHLLSPKLQQKELSWSWYLGQVSRAQPGLQWEEGFPPMSLPHPTHDQTQTAGCTPMGTSDDI